MKIKDHFLSQEIFEIKETPIKGVLKTYPVPENIGKYYESDKYISHHQDSGSLKEFVYKFIQSFNIKYKAKIVRENLSSPNSKDCKILDYGCGAGEFIKSLENKYITYGYEPNEKARNFAKKKSSKTKFIDSLNEIEDNTLDIISLWHVFEHIENQKEILDLFKQKLKPNGTLIIAVPNYKSYDAERYQDFWAAYDVPRHLFHFSREGMKTLMQQEQLKIKKIAPLLLDAFYISILSEKYKKNKLFWLFGGIYGAISNFKASKTGDFSSLIYIVKKN
ncbi:class I SAM-dependent methyltransferase [Riemerella anatipestifer]|uniref:class I SAM-dependent methyltransferase n=1 Tax=Riemerella anatipestifer TaxID=34085 RepID=UPI00129D773F|nr:class I SAM-dependent methyltransferase [Riemerella anatipestifer]MRM83429.1 class I SAM-dependent methyltransferase [Riemerella anatipestifer]